jgi:hypothetical protein
VRKRAKTFRGECWIYPITTEGLGARLFFAFLGHGRGLDGASLLAHGIEAQEVSSVDFIDTLNTILPVFLQDYSCNPGCVTSKAEVIGSSVGLVSRNALVSADSFPARTSVIKSHRNRRVLASSLDVYAPQR